MYHRLQFTLPAIVLAFVCSAGSPALAQLKLVVDRHTGDIDLTGVDETAVDFALYIISSDNSTLVRSNWNGIRDTEADWVLNDDSNNPNVLSEVNENGSRTAGAVVDSTVSFDLGSGVYDPSTALAGLPLGVDVEADDLNLIYYDQIADQQRTGVVEYVGEKIFNDIGITVDLADGRAYLENESPQSSLTITGYIIESTSGGTLNTGPGFTGLGGDFISPTSTPNGDDLGETVRVVGDGQALASSTNVDTLGIDLGVVVAPGSLSAAVDDLVFSFILEGTGQKSQTGFVKYINVPAGVTGDYNEDGVVDAADYAVWRDAAGTALTLPNRDPANTGDVSTADYEAWASNFSPAAGSAVGGAAATAVPEPSSTLLALFSLAGAAWARKRD